jgi:hypothetical protein
MTMTTRFVSRLVLALVLAVPTMLMPGAALQGEDSRFLSEPFVRTELFFGTARETLPPVSDAEWNLFLESTITPRFPEGLTVYAAEGQFHDESGHVIKEKTFVLLLLYPLGDRKGKTEAIEFIRDAYKDAFDQKSVLRVDDPHAMQLSF